MESPKDNLTSNPEKQVVVIKYENGDVYEGQVDKNGKRNGYGKLLVKNKYAYEGEFEDDQEHGQGKFVYENGNTYEGSVKGGKRIGWGKLTAKDKYTYLGEFKDDHANGWGELTTIEYSYAGQMKDYTPDGVGKVTLENGESYHGMFKESKVYNLSPIKKNQKVLVIIKDENLLNKQSVEARYKRVILLRKSSTINQKFLTELITKSTKGKKKKKIKTIITEHASEKGELTNQDFILNTLNKILKETKKYNSKHLKEPVQSIDITLHSCFGSKIVYENKAFQDVMKRFIAAKIDVRVSAGDENFTSLTNYSNGKNVMPFSKTGDYYIVNRFDLNADTDFNNLKPSKIKKYTSIQAFMDDRYEGKIIDDSAQSVNSSKKTKSDKNTKENKENNKPSEDRLTALETPINTTNASKPNSKRLESSKGEEVKSPTLPKR